MKTAAPKIDIITQDAGPFVLAVPKTPKADRYLKRHYPAGQDVTYRNGSLVIEHCYAFDVLSQMLDRGMTLQRSSDGAIARKEANQ